MDKSELDKYRHIYRDFNIVTGLGTFRTHRMYPDVPLTFSEAVILIMLAKNPLISISEISTYLRVNKSSISRKLTTLEKHGYIVRKRVPGKSRKLSYVVTPKSQKYFKIIFDRGTQLLRLMLEHMGKEKFTQFFELMQSATDAINRSIKKYPDLF